MHLHMKVRAWQARPAAAIVVKTTNDSASASPTPQVAVTTTASPPKLPPKACPSPDRFYPWTITSFKKGPDGKALPIEYELDTSKRHKLSFVDIDANDVRFALFLDDKVLGRTERPTNKSMHCGTDVRKCSQMGFNQGSYVIAAGNHTIRLEYDGDGEF